MYGQMTAGSWIYIGSQGIIQGTYETFVSVGRKHYDGSPFSADALGAAMDQRCGIASIRAMMRAASQRLPPNQGASVPPGSRSPEGLGPHRPPYPRDRGGRDSLTRRGPGMGGRLRAR